MDASNGTYQRYLDASRSRTRSRTRAARTAGSTVLSLALGAFVVGLFAAIVFGALTAGVAMIALGIVHSYYAVIPAAGFVPTWASVILLSVLGNTLKGTTANVTTSG